MSKLLTGKDFEPYYQRQRQCNCKGAKIVDKETSQGVVSICSECSAMCKLVMKTRKRK